MGKNSLIKKPVYGEQMCITRAKEVNGWLVENTLSSSELTLNPLAEKALFLSLGIVRMMQQAAGIACDTTRYNVQIVILERIKTIKENVFAVFKGKQKSFIKKELTLLEDSFMRWLKSNPVGKIKM